MANSVEEAIAEAIAEIKTKQWCVDAALDGLYSEDKPCNYVRKRLEVLHQTRDGGYTYSSKELYINKEDFTWLWHYGGAIVEPVPTPFRELVASKIDSVKTAMDLDWIEISEIDEDNESGIVLCVKGTTVGNADTYTLKVWKETDTTVGYKIIGKTSMA